MIALDTAMEESLCYPHWQWVTCVPETAGVPGTPLDVVDGTLRVSGDPPIRRSGSVTVAVPSLSTSAEVEALAEDLAAGGVLLRFTWCVRLLDGREFTSPLGLLRVETAEWSTETGQIALEVVDMGRAVEEDRFLVPRAMSTGTKAEAIEDLLTEAVSGSTVTIDAAVPTTALSAVVWDTDRDAAVTELATSLGALWWWDVEGDWVLVPVPTAATSPADWVLPAVSGAEVATGRASREDTYNAVVVTGQLPEGETGDTPIGIAYDTDPASPTYWSGSFGHKPLFYSSPVLTTNAQCEAAAATLLAGRLGQTKAMTMTLPAHPGLEPYDTVQPGDPEGIWQVIEVTSLPLDGSAMTVSGRRVL